MHMIGLHDPTVNGGWMAALYHANFLAWQSGISCEQIVASLFESVDGEEPCASIVLGASMVWRGEALPRDSSRRNALRLLRPASRCPMPGAGRFCRPHVADTGLAHGIAPRVEAGTHGAVIVGAQRVDLTAGHV